MSLLAGGLALSGFTGPAAAQSEARYVGTWSCKVTTGGARSAAILRLKGNGHFSFDQAVAWRKGDQIHLFGTGKWTANDRNEMRSRFDSLVWDVTETPSFENWPPELQETAQRFVAGMIRELKGIVVVNKIANRSFRGFTIINPLGPDTRCRRVTRRS